MALGLHGRGKFRTLTPKAVPCRAQADVRSAPAHENRQTLWSDAHAQVAGILLA